MDYGSFIRSCLIGGTAALAVFVPLGAKRRVRVPPIVWWLCLIVGGGACVYGLSHSTAPSYATQITAIGKAYDHVERRRGRGTYFGFRFVPDGGEPVDIETLIILPDWGVPAIFDGRTFRVVYLQDNKRFLKNEAI
jgi:hypothetical protein